MVSASRITDTITTMQVDVVIMTMVLTHLLTMELTHHRHPALVVIALDLLLVAVEAAVVVTISTIAVSTDNLSLRLI